MPEPRIAKISQETLAQMVGTTRARVSFFMSKFRKLGFISYSSQRLQDFVVDHPGLYGSRVAVKLRCIT